MNKIDSPQNSRERILYTALELFALNGFAKTSTRQIADMAQVNLSAIKYYFGDKQGLYKAAFTEPAKDQKKDIELLLNAKDIKTALQYFFAGFVAPLTENKNIQLCIKMHMREMFEPTGLRESEIESDIKPHHFALTQVLMKELGVDKADNDIDRMAFSLVGMAVFLYVANDIIGKINASLLDGEAALNEWVNRMSMYALAMIESEKKRRNEI